MNCRYEEVIACAVTVNVDLLDIDDVEFEWHSAKDFPTATTMAAIVGSGKDFKLWLNEDAKWASASDAEILFVVSHEMRHAWQIKNGWKFNCYKQSDELARGEYNDQDAEVDAWAWASVVYEKLVGNAPQLEKIFSCELIEKIKQRKSDIKIISN